MKVYHKQFLILFNLFLLSSFLFSSDWVQISNGSIGESSIFKTEYIKFHFPNEVIYSEVLSAGDNVDRNYIFSYFFLNEDFLRTTTSFQKSSSLSNYLSNNRTISKSSLVSLLDENEFLVYFNGEEQAIENTLHKFYYNNSAIGILGLRAGYDLNDQFACSLYLNIITDMGIICLTLWYEDTEGILEDYFNNYLYFDGKTSTWKSDESKVSFLTSFKEDFISAPYEINQLFNIWSSMEASLEFGVFKQSLFPGREGTSHEDYRKSMENE